MKHFTTFSIVIILAIIIASTIGTAAQSLASGYDESTEYFDSKKHNKWHNSPNFKKALAILNDVDETENIDYESAITLLENEINQHPGNGYAMCSAAMARINEENMELNIFIIELLYGDNGLSEEEAENILHKRIDKSREIAHEVIEMLEKGIALIPVADKENRCKAYIACGDLQKEVLDDDEKTLAAYEQAAAILPCHKSYDKLMRYYLNQGDNDKALFYASKLGNMIDDDNQALCSLAQMYIDNKDYDKAETLINKAIANYDGDKDAHQLLISILMEKGKYQEALDQTIDHLSGNELLENLSALYDVNDDCKSMVINRLHQLGAEADVKRRDDKQETTEWRYFEGLLHYFDKDYRSALTCFDKLMERRLTPSLLSLKADCHYMLGDAPKAIKILDYALRMPEQLGENNQQQLLSDKIRYEMLCGMTDEHIYDSEVYCKAFTDKLDIGYEGMARGYFNKGQYARALEVCDEWADKSVDAIEPRYVRAYVLMLWGKNTQAREEMQDIINDENCSAERKMFALLYMGETVKSRAMLDEMAQNSELVAAATEPDESLIQLETMSFYNLACAYSQHGDIDRALHFLERHYAEDDGVTDFDYAILDDELNNARKDSRFMEIVNRYKQQWLDGKLGSKK